MVNCAMTSGHQYFKLKPAKKTEDDHLEGCEGYHCSDCDACLTGQACICYAR
jgi:hypothetical protein